MALDATIIFEVQTVGDDDNGGGYSSDDGGVDYSRQALAELTLTDLACVTASTTLTSVTGGFTDAMIDNLIQIKSGTNFLAGFYRIVSRADTNTVTLDRTASDGSDATSGTGSVGGALGTPGQAALIATVDNQLIWVKSGSPYVLSTSTPGPGGPVVLLSTVRVSMRGYDSSRGDIGTDTDGAGTKPVLDAGAQTGITLFTVGGLGSDNKYVLGMKADGNSGSGNNGFFCQYGYTFASFCESIDCPGYGFGGNSNSEAGAVQYSRASGCGKGFNDLNELAYCVATDNVVGFDCGNRVAMFTNCLAHDNSGTGFEGRASGLHFVNCTSVGNGGDGFWQNSFGGRFIGCVATNNTGYGYNFTSSDAAKAGILHMCAAYLNTGGTINNESFLQLNLGFITITDGDPWESIGTDDYRPNDTTDRGALLRGASIGVPGQTNNVDIGAVQHADPVGGGGGGGTKLVGPGGGMIG